MRPIRETYNASGPRNTHARATPKSSNSLLFPMSYIDAETGAETAGLLKSPAADKKKSTRGLTALVVACAALSFFAGAAATNGLLKPLAHMCAAWLVKALWLKQALKRHTTSPGLSACPRPDRPAKRNLENGPGYGDHSYRCGAGRRYGLDVRV